MHATSWPPARRSTRAAAKAHRRRPDHGERRPTLQFVSACQAIEAATVEVLGALISTGRITAEAREPVRPHSDMIWCTSITLPSGSWKKIWCHPFIAHVP